MQLNLKQNKCIALGEQNNNLICKNCLKNQVEDWLKKRRPKLVPTLRNKTKIFFKRSKYSNNLICEICNKNINTCDYCFRQYIKEWIKSKYPRLLAEFRLFFDYR